MQTLFVILSAALAVGIVILHLISVKLSNKKSTVLNFVNIALHIFLVLAMLYAGASLELLALVFMLSLFVYVLAFEIKRRTAGKEGDK